MLPSLIQMSNEYGWPLVPHITFGLKFTNTWKKLYNTGKKLSYLHIKLLDMEYTISTSFPRITLFNIYDERQMKLIKLKLRSRQYVKPKGKLHIYIFTKYTTNDCFKIFFKLRMKLCVKTSVPGKIDDTLPKTRWDNFFFFHTVMKSNSDGIYAIKKLYYKIQIPTRTKS